MEAIAKLVQDDPYLRLPIADRLNERRERRARIFAPRQLPSIVNLSPTVRSMAAPTLKRGDPPDYTCMWFYNLVFESQAKLAQILAMRDFESRPLRIDEIQIACARYYGVTRADILSARRTAAVVKPRQVGYYLSKVLTRKSLPEIGRRFGGRDHTSALSGIRKIERLRKIDERLENDLQHLAASLGGCLP